MSREVQVGSGAGATAVLLDEEYRVAPDEHTLTSLEADHAGFNKLVAQAPAANLYHRPPWRELLQRAYGLELRLAATYRGDEPAAALIFAQSKNPFAKRWVALSFSDSCPPLALEDDEARRLLTRLTQTPTAGNIEVRGYAASAPWKTVDCFVDWVLPLGSVKELHRGLDSNFRRNLKRANSAGIELENGAEIEQMRRFYAMQVETRRRFGLPPQPWRFFRLVQEIYGARGELEIRLARVHGEDAAGAVFIRDGATMHYKWGARRVARNDAETGANHLLFWKAIESFAGSAQTLHLGRTDIRNQGLMRFKHGLGAHSIPLPYSYFPRAPVEPSVEVLTGWRKPAAAAWRRMPLGWARVLGSVVYKFLG